MENVDKTIDAICNWIQKELESERVCNSHCVSETIKALAELVSARERVF